MDIALTQILVHLQNAHLGIKRLAQDCNVEYAPVIVTVMSPELIITLRRALHALKASNLDMEIPTSVSHIAPRILQIMAIISIH